MDREGLRAKRARLERVFRERRKNLASQIKAYGSSANLARALGVTPTYLSQIIGPNPRRAIGESSARNFETMLGLPSGWLDTIH